MKIVLALIIALTLSGCSLFQTEVVEVSTTPVERVPLILPEVDLFQARDVEWLIVTPENYQDVVRDLSRKGSPALFALKSRDYENAALNHNDVLKLVQQLQEIINAYENYYQAEYLLDATTNTAPDKPAGPAEAVKPAEEKYPEIE